eukprot:SAG31_NODE_6476_length_2003_cov_2.075630_2_plen_255_part_00
MIVWTVGYPCRWLDDCCRPIKLELDAITYARAGFVAHAVVTMEATAPDVVAMMLKQCATVKLEIAPDGQKAFSAGTVRWDASALPKGLTNVYKDLNQAIDSPSAWAISVADIFFHSSSPLSRHLPEAIARSFVADPTSPSVESFRRYVRHQLVPSMQRIFALLEAHSSVVGSPPLEWLMEQFPTEPWHRLPPSLYRALWLAETTTLESLVAQWDSGDVSVVRPPGATLFPPQGLRKTNDWAIAKGEERQRELIG